MKSSAAVRAMHQARTDRAPRLSRSRTPVADLLAHVAEWRELHPENHESSFAIMDRLSWQHGMPLARERAHRLYIESWDALGFCPQQHDDIVAALLATSAQARADGE